MPVGWRCTTVAPSASASTTRSRSLPAGRSNTASSSAGTSVVPSSMPRMTQLDSPSAKRRAVAMDSCAMGLCVMVSCDASSHAAAATVGEMIAPKVGTRRSCTAGRSA
jgi:hypothetical protein